MSPSERKAMINPDRTDLSLTWQCKLLKISRSYLYYATIGMNAETLELMNEIDRVFTKHPVFLCPAGHCAAMAREGEAARLQPICRETGSMPVAIARAPFDGRHGVAGDL
jgi:hypothetical protein